MKTMKRLLFLLLAAALILSCAAGTAESLPPMFSIDQEAFLSWFRTYDPDAGIVWYPWRYTPSYLRPDDYGNYIAMLSEDASRVEKVSFNWSGSTLSDDQVKLIRQFCAAVGDSLSDESLQKIQTLKTPDMDWQEAAALGGREICKSDGGKLTFCAGEYAFELLIVFSDEASASFTQDDLYSFTGKLRNDLLYVTLSRYGEISLDTDNTPPEGALGAEITLNCEGALHGIDVMCKGKSPEETEAFFLDAAGLFLSGEQMDSAQTLIREQLPAVMADDGRTDLHMDPVSIGMYSDAYNGVRISFYCSVVPADAAGFINGMKLTRKEGMRAND